MTDNWKEITDPQELFRLNQEGWEIEYKHVGAKDANAFVFRARPPQPKMKKVKLLAYVSLNYMYYVRDDAVDDVADKSWIRAPAEDKEIEVSE